MATAKKTTKTVKAAPKKEAAVKVEKAAKTEKVAASLTVDVFDTAGKTVETVTLPEALFGAKVNPVLMAQAIRVYLVNQRQGTVSTKTRGEVEGSTRKIYRQKGTGRARHGGIRAPIFVKGGVAHGPKPKEYELSLSKNMKKAAFASALTAKLHGNGIKVVTGVEKLGMKTKAFAEAFSKWGMDAKKRNALVVLPKDSKEIYKAMRNLVGVDVTTAQRLNTFEVLKYTTVVLLKDTVEVFAKEHTK
ncbi:MAG: 50S ribosomal protein L4 [Patescibacteria group bacterium]|nr:50S ribosomal protein L4 [Patescibacteria group bacterium]MDE2589718.1 50S ribosomal protein L4 [Patescibacteria group bacterium]